MTHYDSKCLNTVNEKKLSIIIVSYKVKDHILSCLSSIFENRADWPLEVILVDNNSKDSTVDMIKDDFKNVIIIENDRNLGFAVANNQGLKKATGEYILFLNPDTKVLPETFDKSIAFLENNPEAGAVGCRILNPDGTLQYSCKSYPSFWNYFFESTFLYKLFPKNRWIGKFYMTNFDYAEVKEVDVVSGAYLLMRSRLLEEIGGWDERFFIYSEETDLCYRIKKSGKKIYFIPQAQIIHWGGKSTSQSPVEMFKQDHKSRYLFMRKHYNMITIFFSECIIFIGVCLRTALWGLLNIFRTLFRKPGAEEARLKSGIFFRLFQWYLKFEFLKNN